MSCGEVESICPSGSATHGRGQRSGDGCAGTGPVPECEASVLRSPVSKGSQQSGSLYEISPCVSVSTVLFWLISAPSATSL